jgi:2,4-dienoyl-CoA reductase-like NADH-dependent reductase (Old Yellow Enzyme family)
MDPIFTPWRLGSLELPNRLVRSATWEGMAQVNGAVTEELAGFTADLAAGGVGLIISGYAYVSPDGLGLPKQTGVYSDILVGSLAMMSDAVHAAGGRIAIQIVHAGGQTRSEWIGGTPVGPSAMVHPQFGEVEELSVGRIHDIVADFAAAARRSREAGFDAVQLHGAHGYLVNQFLSPNTNRRTDEYGGSLANRARFCFEVYDAVRNEVGPDYPVFIKLNSDDAVEGGLELAEAVEVARGLSERGIDAIEVSGGVPSAGARSAARLVKSLDDEAYFLDNARAIKDAVDCPVITVGGYRSRAKIAEALEWVDAVALSRPLIRQPDLANLFKDGGTDVADCVSCGGCFKLGLEQGIGCAVLRGAT